MHKGQISVEHLFMLMLAISIVIPGTTLFYNFSKNSNQQVVSSQINRIGNEIMRNAEILDFLGEGSRMRLVFHFPGSMKSLELRGEEMSINYSSYAGPGEAVFFPDVTIKGMHGIDKELIAPVFHTGTISIMLLNTGGHIMAWEEGTENE